MEHSMCEETLSSPFELHRIRLEQEKRNLERAMNETDEQLRVLNRGSINEAVEVGVSSDRELLFERRSLYRQKLRLIVQSLERMHDGTFSRCFGCEGPIGEKRLQAIPFARYCIKCQEDREGDGITDEPRVRSET
jgi:DnaK suppressor protein